MASDPSISKERETEEGEEFNRFRYPEKSSFHPQFAPVWQSRVSYSRVCSTRVWSTLEYATSKEDCTLESKSCLESVAAPTLNLQDGKYNVRVCQVSGRDIERQCQVYCLSLLEPPTVRCCIHTICDPTRQKQDFVAKNQNQFYSLMRFYAVRPFK